MIPEDLKPERVHAALCTRRFGRSLEVRGETGSTNDDAREAIARGAPDGHVVLADRQRAGRGARGRTWSSPGGTDLYFSIVARTDLALPRLAPLTLAVGLGVAEAASALAPSAVVQVKWPNDVLVGGRKTAGVLVEASTRGAALEGVVIGVGVGVNRERFEGELAETATSLRIASGAPHDRALVLARVLEAIEREVDRFVAHGPAAIVARVEARLALAGERVTCDEVEGVLVGLAPSGALRLETREGPRELIAGTLRRA